MLAPHPLGIKLWTGIWKDNKDLGTPDSLARYMGCPFLWALVYHTTGTHHHMDILSERDKWGQL